MHAIFDDRWTRARLPPRSVRSTGITPWVRESTEADLSSRLATNIQDLSARYAGGTVGVIAPTRRVARLRDGVPEASVLDASEAKGLEFDATIVVDPHGIAAEPRGWNRLYVALTRCTQELGQLRPTAH